MKDHDQFGDRATGKPADGPSGQLDCAAVELLWVEAAEGTLPSAVAEQLRAHTTECASCREKMSQACRGREWLQLLKQEPLVPPADMVAKILTMTMGTSDMSTRLAKRATLNVSAQADARPAERYGLPGYTSADNPAAHIPAESSNADDVLRREGVAAASAIPVWHRPSVVMLRRTVFEPRMALVAAMAFFSISLTLNLMGVKLTRFRASDLEPQAMRRAVTRQYAQANARVVHYYENLRIVYEVESRVHQLRQAADTGAVPDKTGYPQGKQGSGAGGNGQVHREGQNGQSDWDEMRRERMAVSPTANQNARRNHSAPAEPKPIFSGPLIDAYFQAKPLLPGLNVFERAQPRFVSTVFFAVIPSTVSQASSYSLQIVRFSVQERKSA